MSLQERFACGVAERVTGVVARAWDVGGKQGAVDAMLTLLDGREAAFEVTTVGRQDALHTVSLLGHDNYKWPAAGEWWWSISVGSAQDIPRLKLVYRRIARLCEAAGVQRPEDLPYRDPSRTDEDIAWLTNESSSSMTGHRTVLAEDASRSRGTSVMPSGDGGAVDEELIGLRAALEAAFATGNLAGHLAKVGRADTDERHLFLVIHRTALGFPVFYGLAFGDALPPDPPPLPGAVTHLWLAPSLGRRVLLWDGEGWSEHHPYDN
jgi:hypothetical protein